MTSLVEQYEHALQLGLGSTDHVAAAGTVLLGKRQPFHSLCCSGGGSLDHRAALKMGRVDALGSLRHLMMCDYSLEQQ